MTEKLLTGTLSLNTNKTVTDVLEKLCQVDKYVSQIDLRIWRAKQALITDIFRMYKQCGVSDISKFNSSGLLSCKLKFHIHEKGE